VAAKEWVRWAAEAPEAARTAWVVQVERTAAAGMAVVSTGVVEMAAVSWAVAVEETKAAAAKAAGATGAEATEAV